MRLETWQRGLAAALIGADNTWPGQAMAVHRANATGARVDALAAVFPVLRQVLGERCFHTYARRFVMAVPSRSADLNLCGGGFPSWLRTRTHRQPAFAALPYLKDLGRLELAVNAAYYAADDAPVDPGSLSTTLAEPSRWRLRMSCSLRLLRSPWPVAAIWRAHRLGKGTDPVSAGECRAVVCRTGHTVRVRAVSARTWRALRAALGACPLDQVARHGMDARIMGACVRAQWILGARRMRGL